MPEKNGFTRWVIGTLTTVVLLGGAGWIGSIQGQVSDVKKQQRQDYESQNKTSNEVSAIKQKLEDVDKRVQRIENSTDEIKQILIKRREGIHGR